MKMCRIEVIKCNFDEALSNEYAVEGFGPCQVHKTGDVYYANFMKPQGLCDEAWKAIHPFVFALCHGAEDFFDGTWINDPKTVIACCNDGLRPVVFKIERTDEDWNPNQ